VGVLCLVLGFVIIAITYYLVINGQFGVSTKTIIGVLGGVAGLLSNFVAVMYVKMYTEAIKSLIAFHNRLVETHHMHYGAFLAAKIKSHILLDKTFSHMAIGTVWKPKDTGEVSPATLDGDKEPEKATPKKKAELKEPAPDRDDSVNDSDAVTNCLESPEEPQQK